MRDNFPTDEKILEAFENTNYGIKGLEYYKKVLATGVLTCIGDYHNGSTTTRILIQLGMITPKGTPTKMGRRYCCLYYYNR